MLIYEIYNNIIKKNLKKYLKKNKYKNLKLIIEISPQIFKLFIIDYFNFFLSLSNIK